MMQPAAWLARAAIKLPRTRFFIWFCSLGVFLLDHVWTTRPQYLFNAKTKARIAPACCDAPQSHWQIQVCVAHEDTSSKSSTPPKLTVLPAITVRCSGAGA